MCVKGLGLLLAVSGEEDQEAVRTFLPQSLPCLCFIVTHLALLIGRTASQLGRGLYFTMIIRVVEPGQL